MKIEFSPLYEIPTKHMHKLVIRYQLKIESIETKLKLKLSINKNIYVWKVLIPIGIDTIGIEKHTYIQTYMSIQEKSILIPIEKIQWYQLKQQ